MFVVFPGRGDNPNAKGSDSPVRIKSILMLVTNPSDKQNGYKESGKVELDKYPATSSM